MGFGQALSGLNAASQNLDVIGNNIANASTVGYKAGYASFADVYASSRIGLGVQVAAVNQRFATGNVEITGNQYDMAIDGANGFFRLVSSNGEVSYSRNGQFTKDKDHYIVNAQGQRLSGYPQGGIGLDPEPLRVPVGNIAPRATGTDPDAPGISAVLNLDSSSDIIPLPSATPAGPNFNPTDPNSFTNAAPLTVYDSLGNAHDFTQYFVKREGTATSSVWDVYYVLDGQPMAPTTVTPPTPPATEPIWGDATQLSFDTSGRLTSVTTPAGVTDPTSLTLTFANPGGTESPADPLSIPINYGGTTQFNNPFKQNMVQDGYSSGEFASIAVGADGTVMASYTNGKTQAVGTVVLASFNNVNGLQPIGGNAWAESPTSGQPILGQPGTNGLASIKGQAVESSNVDMSQELVNMIIAQRTYQANAQTIKTQDQIMQTLISMR